jgi:hypothetical protein
VTNTATITQTQVVVVPETHTQLIAVDDTEIQVITVGTQGPEGIQGPAGPAGTGVPSGGTTGQVLTKNSNTDFDTSWQNGGGGSATSSYTSQNKAVATFVPGQPLAVDSSGTGVVLASAADNNKKAVGLATVGVAVGQAETVQTGGIITLSDWTAVTGAPTLSPVGVYYLSATAGMLTTIAPTTQGQVAQVVGRAVSTTQLELTFSNPILL